MQKFPFLYLLPKFQKPKEWNMNEKKKIHGVIFF